MDEQINHTKPMVAVVTRIKYLAGKFWSFHPQIKMFKK
jgi:hypothetical protein